jgi:peptidoglycan/xylan/chitin deacetylase (PgdA/CDA1 family)
VATGFLMYHELAEPGRPVVDDDPGYTTYVLDHATFAEQMAWIASAGLRGISVGDWCAARDLPGRVVITFDDGCETDWTMAAPRLLERGFGATFYVVSAWIGRRAGFMTAAQLRELADAGFEIGSHSVTHAFLSDAAGEGLASELRDSKSRLEDLLGRAVTHFSCPGGRWSRDVESVAREIGYATVATSRVGANSAATNPYALARCAMQRHTAPRAFEAFCRGEGLGAMRVRERALAAAKAVLGNRVYDALRGAALKRGSVLRSS